VDFQVHDLSRMPDLFLGRKRVGLAYTRPPITPVENKRPVEKISLKIAAIGSQLRKLG